MVDRLSPQDLGLIIPLPNGLYMSSVENPYDIPLNPGWLKTGS